MKTFCIAVAGALLIPSLVGAQGDSGAAPGHFCATYSDDGAPEDCSFTSMAMCEQSVSGVGGFCAPQSSAPVVPPPPLFRLFNPPSVDAAAPAAVPAPPVQWPNPPPPAAFAPAVVPPPPVDQQSSGPSQLPDSPQGQP